MVNEQSSTQVNKPETVIGLLRHGQTLWNAQKRIQGSSDSPLTSQGMKEVVSWTKIPIMQQWERIVSSNLGRARETTKILNEALNLPVHIEQRLREQDWGQWETQTLDEVRSHSGELLEKQIQSGWQFTAPGGESRRDVLNRALSALNDIVTTWEGERILIVCHQGIIQCLLYHLKERLFLPSEKKLLQKRALHILEYSNNRFQISALNLPLGQ